MTQQATTTTTVRLVESFVGNGEVEGRNIFHETSHNRLYQTVDGMRYVITSWAGDDPQFPPNVVAWETQDAKGEPNIEYVFAFMVDSENVPHTDGPDTDETHEATLAQIGYTVERQEEDAA